MTNEQQIFKMTYEALRADSSILSIAISDGEEEHKINADMPFEKVQEIGFSTDMTAFIVVRKIAPNVLRHLFIEFVWGNDTDCIHDYSTGLEDIMKPVCDRVDSMDE